MKLQLRKLPPKANWVLEEVRQDRMHLLPDLFTWVVLIEQFTNRKDA